MTPQHQQKEWFILGAGLGAPSATAVRAWSESLWELPGSRLSQKEEVGAFFFFFFFHFIFMLEQQTYGQDKNERASPSKP
jgi:hypothetical protein